MHVCNNEEMALNYMEVLVDSCCSRLRRILMAKDHARQRNKPFYAKTKVNAFAIFEVGRLIKKKKKMMEKSAV